MKVPVTAVGCLPDALGGPRKSVASPVHLFIGAVDAVQGLPRVRSRGVRLGWSDWRRARVKAREGPLPFASSDARDLCE